MTAEQYLGQLRNLDECINQDLRRLETLRGSARQDSAITYDSVKVQSSPQDRMADVCAAIVDLDRKINQEIDALYDAKEKIILQIRQLHDVYCNVVLYSIYVEYKSMAQTSRDAGMSYDTVKKYHRIGLQKFYDAYKDDMDFLVI